MSKRRDFIKLSLSGAALAGLNRGCQERSQAAPPYHSDEVNELTDGRTLYDVRGVYRNRISLNIDFCSKIAYNCTQNGYKK